MKSIIIFFTFISIGLSAHAQKRMRDVFAQLPDSVLPLMTRNNRLDCIDFIENGMEARVKNRFGEHAVLDSLTADYLSLRPSASSCVEMKMLPQPNDTLICVNRTYLGPARDSEVRLYDMEWNYVRTVPRPSLEHFLKKADEILPWKEEMADTMRMIRAEAEFLTLVGAGLSPHSTEICWTLQSQEFSRDIKRVADRYLQKVKRKL